MPLKNLNLEQLSAVTAPMGNNLVIASAGTGKTSTIVGRIANLLRNGIDPSKILLLTFTNKASGEMLQRVGRYFPSDVVNRIEAGTFHAVSYRWLKRLNSAVILKQPNELKTLFRSIYEKRDLKRLNLELEAFSASHLYEQYNLYQNISILLDLIKWVYRISIGGGLEDGLLGFFSLGFLEEYVGGHKKTRLISHTLQWAYF